MAVPFSRYDFVHQSDGCWTWQRTNPDGSTTHLSARRKDIGAIMGDAVVVAHGFRPHVDHWIIDDYHSVTYFEPGSLPKVLSKRDIIPDVDRGVVSVPVGFRQDQQQEQQQPQPKHE